LIAEKWEEVIVIVTDSEALLTQASAIISKQDSLQAFPKKGKRNGEELKAVETTGI